MAELDITRWRRFGHDRLYISQGGTPLGYWDLATDLACPSAPEHATVIAEAAARWLERANTGAAGSPSPMQSSAEQPHADESGPAPAAVPPPWSDLAHNLPGAAARAQAQALRDAAPVRTFLARVVGAKTDERAWRIGADGEEAVAHRLAKLGPRWRVLHAVPVGRRGSDIDHVLIGPGGVFTLNAKHHPETNVWVYYDAFVVNGRKLPYVRNSRHEAQRASRLLSASLGAPVPVTGVVVVVGAHKGFTIKAQPNDVRVVARKRMVAWLHEIPEVLSDDQIEQIYERARRSTTWQPRR